MKSIELKVTRIGNSRGIRIPAPTLARYEIEDTIIMEETLEGILLRPHGPAIRKLSLADTAAQMAEEHEDWSEWETTDDDGLAQIPWEEKPSRRVAEPDQSYRRKKKK
jgi:antitoxin component of MazEF toxin-antitoxin module